MLPLTVIDHPKPLDTASCWDYLMPSVKRRQTSKLRWRVLQLGEPLETHWPALCEAWQAEPDFRGTELPEESRRLLQVESELSDPVDRTRKWLLRCRDGRCVETVLIPNNRTDRATVCVSSQVGCGVRCEFCETGRLGLVRNLQTAEILEQILIARQAAYSTGLRLRNVVFMGMGEPLHNWGNVSAAIDWMLRDDGFYFSGSHVTISTAGSLRNLWDCATRFPKLRLAISLHSCVPPIRRRLVPRGVGSVEEIRNAIVAINEQFPGRTVWLEVVMIRGLTDRAEDIAAIIEFCRGLTVEINLIPFNSLKSAGDEGLQRTDTARIRDVAIRLRAAGIFTTIRYSGGQNIAAACGQLAARG